MKLFVWDFHGVLEQGNELAAWKVTNLVLQDFGYKERLSKKVALQLAGRKWYEYFETALPNEPHEKHLLLQQAGFEFTAHNFEFVATFLKPNPHAKKVIAEISKKHQQVLISNTDPVSLVLYVKSVDIHEYFTSANCFAAKGHRKNSKHLNENILKDFIGDKKFEEIIIIGDSPSDMTLREVAGGKTYLYCHPGMTHRECGADYKITDLRQLLAEI